MTFLGPDSPLRGPRFWIALASFAVVASMALVNLERTAPGPLSAVHGLALAEAGSAPTDCAACHGGWFESLAGACADCHGGIEEDRQAGHGLHGNMTADAEACGTCHGEHNGPGFQLAGPRSFRLAGLLGEAWGPDADRGPAGREGFDHARVGFDLGGAHLALACVDCHAAADLNPLPPGTPRFRGLDADCASCHADEHAPVFPKDCTSCHNQSDWDTRGFAGHAAFFPREAAHAAADCRDCHGADTPHSLEVKLGRKGGGLPDVRACADCHAVPHSAALLAVEVAAAEAPTMALGQAPAESAACAACHAVGDGAFRTAAERFTPELHAAAGFGFGAAHAELACAACHAPSEREAWPVASRGGAPGDALVAEDATAALAEFAAAHPGRTRQDCAACHADPHAGQFAVGERALACVSCHAENAFAGHGFDGARHAELDLGLTGAHGALECASCHGAVALKGDWPAAEVPGAVSAWLAAITSDGDALLGAAVRARAGEPLGVGAPDLELRVVPPAGSAAPLRVDLPAGSRVRVFRGTQAECASCHGDAHAGFPFAASMSCADCHNDEAFDAASADFRHQAETGFDLAGAHGQADCASCHVPLDAATPEGRLFGSIATALAAQERLGATELQAGTHPTLSPALARGADTACAYCHADPHAGVFAATHIEADSGLTDCAACHSTTSFRQLPDGFDHALSTSFALDGRHAALDCAACHSAPELGAHAPALGRDCASCHAEPHGGQFEASPRGNDCARCHSTAVRFAEPTFNHTFDSDFVLEGRHRELSCAECHTEEAFDGALVRRYWPVDDDCASCHGEVRGSGVLRRSQPGGGR